MPDQASASGSGLLDLARARESLSEQDALLQGATDNQARVRITELIVSRRLLLTQAAEQMPQQILARYRALTQDPSAVALQDRDDDWIRAPAGAQHPSTTDWLTALNNYGNSLRTLEVSAIHAAAQAAVPSAVATVAGAGLLAGVGLVAVLAIAGALWRNN